MSSKAYREAYSSMTEKQKDIMYDLCMKAVSHDGQMWNMYCDIEDAVAGIVKEQMPPATQSNTSNTLSALDVIDRQKALDTLAEAMPSLTTPDGCGQFDHDIQVTDEAYVDCMRIIHDLPPAQPTLYGYSIEFLAMVAEIMKKENVGPEEALQLFKSASYIAELVRAEWYENVQRQMEQMFEGEQDGAV